MRWFGHRETKPEGSTKARSSEAGDTLIEVLLAVTILGIAGVALLTGFITAITASGTHRNLATQNTSIRVATDQVTSFLEANSTALFACTGTAYPPWDPKFLFAHGVAERLFNHQQLEQLHDLELFGAVLERFSLRRRDLLGLEPGPPALDDERHLGWHHDSG